MSRDVEHLEMTVAEIDNVARFQEPRSGRRAHSIAILVEPVGRQAIEHVELCKTGCQGVCGSGRFEYLSLEFVAGSVRELMMIADMVEMGVTCDRNRVLEPREPVDETYCSEPGVEQDASVAAAHMPDVSGRTA